MPCTVCSTVCKLPQENTANSSLVRTLDGPMLAFAPLQCRSINSASCLAGWLLEWPVTAYLVPHARTSRLSRHARPDRTRALRSQKTALWSPPPTWAARVHDGRAGTGRTCSVSPYMENPICPKAPISGHAAGAMPRAVFGGAARRGNGKARGATTRPRGSALAGRTLRNLARNAHGNPRNANMAVPPCGCGLALAGGHTRDGGQHDSRVHIRPCRVWAGLILVNVHGADKMIVRVRADPCRFSWIDI